MQSHKTIIVIGYKDQLDIFFQQNANISINRRVYENKDWSMEYKNESYTWLGYDIHYAIKECSGKSNPFAFVYLGEEYQSQFDNKYRHSSTIALSALVRDNGIALLEQMLELDKRKSDEEIIFMQCVNSVGKVNEKERIKKAWLEEISRLPKNIYMYGKENECEYFFRNNLKSYNSSVSFWTFAKKFINDDFDYQFSKSTCKFNSIAPTYACIYFNDTIQDDVVRKEYSYQCLAIRALPDENGLDLFNEIRTIRKNIFYGAASLVYSLKCTTINFNDDKSMFALFSSEIVYDICKKYFSIMCKDVFFTPKAREEKEKKAENLIRPVL